MQGKRVNSVSMIQFSIQNLKKALVPPKFELVILSCELRILMVKLIYSSLVGEINEFLKKLYFFLNDEYYSNFFFGINLNKATKLIPSPSRVCIWNFPL